MDPHAASPHLKSAERKSSVSARKALARYGFKRKSHVAEALVVLLVTGLVAIGTWLLVDLFGFARVPWSQAATAAIAFTVAMVAYRQWLATRHEISIDKYYDRLDAANKRLEVLEDVSKEDAHTFVELDKLEYVIVKYELGYVPPALAMRALENFQALCRDRPGFHANAIYWIGTATYLEVTRAAVRTICSQCEAAPRVPEPVSRLRWRRPMYIVLLGAFIAHTLSRALRSSVRVDNARQYSVQKTPHAIR